MDAREETNMKEVLTKSFWQGVKKNFYEALEDPPPDTTDSPQPPAEINPNASLKSETPSAGS
jgi:hypothetical protein